ncbi:MAG: cyclase family protein [Candidatus Velthaea sp.]
MQHAVSGLSSLSTMLRQGRWVDLSLPISEIHPRYPAQMPFQQKITNWFTETGLPGESTAAGIYYSAWWTIDEHTGTHCDPPSHWVPPASANLSRSSPLGDIGVDRLEISDLQGPACVIDVTAIVGHAGDGVSPKIEVKHIEEWEAEHGPLQPGDVVLLRADWDERYLPGAQGASWARDVVERKCVGWPAPAPEMVVALHERGVKLLGTDGVSMGASEDGDPAHFAGLSRGMIYIEALAQLRTLPPRGAYFIFLPLKVVDASGGPGRAIAFLPPTSM